MVPERFFPHMRRQRRFAPVSKTPILIPTLLMLTARTRTDVTNGTAKTPIPHRNRTMDRRKRGLKDWKSIPPRMAPKRYPTLRPANTQEILGSVVSRCFCRLSSVGPRMARHRPKHKNAKHRARVFLSFLLSFFPPFKTSSTFFTRLPPIRLRPRLLSYKISSSSESAILSLPVENLQMMWSWLAFGAQC